MVLPPLEPRRSAKDHVEGDQKHVPDDLGCNRLPQRNGNREEKNERSAQGSVEAETHDFSRQVTPDQAPSATRVPPGCSEEEIAQSQSQRIENRGQRILLVAPEDRCRKWEERDQKQGSEIQRDQPAIVAPDVFEALVMSIPDRGDSHKADDVAAEGRRLAG